MRLVPALLIVAGCGRFGFDARPDGGADSSGLPDAPDMVGSFTTVKLPPGGHARSVTLWDTLSNYYVGYAGGRVFHVQNGVWTECTPIGADIRELALAKDGTLYAARRDDQLSVSADNCASYTTVAAPAGAYAVSASDVDAFVGGYDGIWRYTHATNQFARFTSPFDGLVVRDVVQASGSRIAVAAEGALGVYHNGAWHSTTTGDRGYRIAFDPINSTIVYATGENGVYKSTTSGDSFALTSVTGYHDIIAVDPASQHILVMSGDTLDVSTDGMATLPTVDHRNATTAKGWPDTIIFDPAGSGQCLMAMETGMFMADDTALAWKRIDTGVDGWWIDAVGESASAIYAGASGKLMVQRAGTWSDGSLNAQSTATYGITVDPTNPDRVYVMGDAFERSDDAGKTFSTVLPSSQTDGWSFNALVFQGTRLWTSSYARLTYSDNGSTFMQASLGGISRLVTKGLVRANGTEIVAVTDGGVWWSIDNGTSFAASNTGLADIDLRGSLAETADGRIVIGNSDGVWAASTRGATWTRIGFAGKWIDDLLVTPSGAIVAAVQMDGVFVSHDSGATWNPLPGLETYRPWVLAKGLGSTLLVGTQGHGLFRAALP